jgi:hypothetical protein
MSKNWGFSNTPLLLRKRKKYMENISQGMALTLVDSDCGGS